MTLDREQYLNNEESAAFLKVSPATLNTWRSRGLGPKYYKAGRRVLYKSQDLEEYINSGLVMTRDSFGRRAHG